jgi:hypothetical protein
VPERLDRAHVDVAGEIVAITWDERERLIEKLRGVAGSGPVIARFEAVGVSKPVGLDDAERTYLRVALEVWDGANELPAGDGIVHLLVALVRADPGGHVGTEYLDG